MSIISHAKVTKDAQLNYPPNILLALKALPVMVTDLPNHLRWSRHATWQVYAQCVVIVGGVFYWPRKSAIDFTGAMLGLGPEPCWGFGQSHSRATLDALLNYPPSILLTLKVLPVMVTDLSNHLRWSRHAAWQVHAQCVVIVGGGFNWPRKSAIGFTGAMLGLWPEPFQSNA